MKKRFHDDGLSDSLWAATATEPSEHPALNDALDVEVAIVGAGFTGLRAAHKLASAGVNVAVLDAGHVGFGASGRNGGQVNPVLPFNGPDRVRELIGTKYFERLTEASLNSADSLFSYIEKHQIDCQPRQNGWLRVDHCRKARDVSRKNAEQWSRFGAEMRYVESAEIHKLTGTSAYNSGVLTAKGGAVQPLSLVRGIAHLAKGEGAQIFNRTPVNRLVQTSEGWTLETKGGPVKAQWVVMATNGYTDQLLMGLKSTIFPLVSLQIATAPLGDEQISAILPNGQTISDTRRVIMYARREPDNRIVFGGHGKIKRDGSFAGFDWLKKDAERVFPELKGMEWAYAWGGKIAITNDRLPHFHEPAKGLIAGLGYNGRGVAMSNLMGTVLADRVLGAAPESLPFPVSPIKKIPFREFQLLGEGTAIWWMKMLDRLELFAGPR